MSSTTPETSEEETRVSSFFESKLTSKIISSLGYLVAEEFNREYRLKVGELAREMSSKYVAEMRQRIFCDKPPPGGGFMEIHSMGINFIPTILELAGRGKKLTVVPGVDVMRVVGATSRFTSGFNLTLPSLSLGGEQSMFHQINSAQMSIGDDYMLECGYAVFKDKTYAPGERVMQSMGLSFSHNYYTRNRLAGTLEMRADLRNRVMEVSGVTELGRFYEAKSSLTALSGPPTPDGEASGLLLGVSVRQELQDRAQDIARSTLSGDEVEVLQLVNSVVSHLRPGRKIGLAIAESPHLERFFRRLCAPDWGLGGVYGGHIDIM